MYPIDLTIVSKDQITWGQVPCTMYVSIEPHRAEIII